MLHFALFCFVYGNIKGEVKQMPNFRKFQLRQLEHMFAVLCTHGQQCTYLISLVKIKRFGDYNGIITVEVWLGGTW